MEVEKKFFFKKEEKILLKVKLEEVKKKEKVLKEIKNVIKVEKDKKNVLVLSKEQKKEVIQKKEKLKLKVKVFVKIESKLISVKLEIEKIFKDNKYSYIISRLIQEISVSFVRKIVKRIELLQGNFKVFFLEKVDIVKRSQFVIRQVRFLRKSKELFIVEDNKDLIFRFKFILRFGVYRR